MYVPASMRSGMIAWSNGASASRSAPLMRMTSVPAPSTSAPILLSTRPSSSTSGSRAQFTSVVRPFASAAAIMRFSVPVTVGRSNAKLRAAQSPAAARPLGDDVAALEADGAPHRLEPLQVLVDRARANRAASGERNLRASVPRDERPEDQHARAHLLHELVRCLRADLAARRLERDLGRRDVHLATEEAEQRRGRRDVPQIGNIPQAARAVGQERGAQDRERGVLRAADCERCRGAGSSRREL